MKRVLSFLLTVSLLVGCLSAGFVGVATGGYSPNKSDNISIEVTTEQETYNWGDELVFSVKTHNNTESSYKNVRIRAQANKSKFFYDGESNAVIIDELKAGETKSVEIRVLSSKPNIIQRLFILPIYYIIDYLSPMAFNENNYDAAIKVKVGTFKYKFGFEIMKGIESEPSSPESPDTPTEPRKEYKVSFDLNFDGAENVIPVQSVQEGKCVVIPIAPQREGYVFSDWYTDREATAKFDFSVAVSDDIVLYAKWIRNGDNLVDEIIDLGDIQTLEDEGQIEVIYDESGSINTIDGSFTNKKIFSTKDAADLLQSAESLFDTNFDVSEENISVQTLEDNRETFYKYSPSIDGLKVIGGQIVVSTDATGSVTGLFSAYDSKINDIDNEPSITEKEAIALAKNELLSDEVITAYAEQKNLSEEELNEIFEDFVETTCELVVYSTMEEPRPVLVYEIDFSDQLSTRENLEPDDETDEIDEEELDVLPMFAFNKTVYIYANGEYLGAVYRIISSEEGWTNVNHTSRDLNGVNRTYVAQTNGSKYRLVDAGRNITTYKDLPLINIIINSSHDVFARGASVHYNMEQVYDFYKTILSRKSFDGKGAAILLKVRYLFADRNASWDREGQYFCFENGGFEAALDVVGHEFTHAVINYVVGNGHDQTLTYYGESGALNESYADIMGEIIEGKNGADNWLHGEDAEKANRSFSKPSLYNQPEHYSKKYVGKDDKGGVHKNSGIFNFAAYKMMTDARTRGISRETWAHVFYNSLFRLNTMSNFLQARGAIINAAKGLGFTSVQQQAIKDAFDAVGITEPDTIRIVLTWGETPADLDSHLVGPTSNGERFHVYFGQRNFYEDGTYSSDNDIKNSIYKVDLDYDDTDSYGPEIITIHAKTPGDYYYYVHDFSNGGSLSNTELAESGAVVKVYTNARKTPIREYRIPTTGTGTYWNVFKLNISGDEYDSITLWELNTFSNEQKYY